MSTKRRTLSAMTSVTAICLSAMGIARAEGPSPAAKPHVTTIVKGNDNEDVYEQGKVELAEKYYEEGLALLEQGRVQEACRKLQKSWDNDPQPSTRFELAECLAMMGRLATAQDIFLEIASAARAQNNASGEELARKRATELASLVPYVVVHVPPEVARLPSLKVMLDDTEVPPDWFNSGRLKVDIGEHTVIVTAKNKQPFRRRVTISEKGQHENVLVALLVDEWPDPSTSRTNRYQTAIGTTFVVVGGVSFLGGIVGVIVEATRSDVPRLVDDLVNQPYLPESKNAVVAASQQRVAWGTVAGGALGFGIAAGIGGVLLLYYRSDAPQAAGASLRLEPLVGPRYGGIGFSGRF